MKLAVRGMMPRNIITKDSLTRLKIYRGAEHIHAAQKPEPWAGTNQEVTRLCIRARSLIMYGTGRRKSSVARVHLFPNGTGTITINGRDIDDYFGLETLKLIVRQPLDTTDLLGKVDIVCHRHRRRRDRPGRRHPPRHLPRPAGGERRVSRPL